MRNLLDRMENTTASFYNWIVAFFGLIVVKVVLENLANDNALGAVLSDAASSLHIGLWFLGSYLSLVLIAYFFTLEPIDKISKYFLFVHLLIWLTPIIDLVFFQGQAQRLGYAYISCKDLVFNFLTFGADYATLSLGQRIVVPLVILLLGYYTYAKTKNWPKTILSAILGYAAIYLWGSIPSVIFAVVNLFTGATDVMSMDVVNFFLTSGNNLVLTQNLLTAGVDYPRELISEVVQVNIFSKIFYLICLILILGWAWIYKKSQTQAVIGNIRFFGIIHYYFHALIGLFLARELPGLKFDWVFVVSTVVMFLAIYCAYMFAMGVNDIYDFDTDKISNPERPLITNTVSKEELASYNLGFLILALAGAFLSGEITFYLILLVLAISYIYSAPPLRLKRVPFLATFLIGLASLTVLMIGFFFMNFSKSIEAFPYQYVFAILIFHTLWGNVKDLKDKAGDQNSGVITIANQFEEKTAKLLITLLCTAAYFIVPLIIKADDLLFFALFASIATGLMIYQKKYNHMSVFLVYFTYLLTILFIIS